MLLIYVAGCPEIQEAWSQGPHVNLEWSCWIERLHMEAWQAVSDMNYTVGHLISFHQELGNSLVWEEPSHEVLIGDWLDPTPVC